MIEFENTEKAQQWWNSEEYKEPKDIRQRASISHSILIQGV